MLQPILVTETLDGYQLVAGERRVRAAADRRPRAHPGGRPPARRPQQLELALVENLQRADLDPMEEARAYRQLIDEFGFTPGGPRRAASGGLDRRSRTRSGCSTCTRPSRTPSRTAAITEGHARALGGLPLEDQARVVGMVVDEGLSVRQTEELVRRLREPREPRSRRGAGARRPRPRAGRGGPPRARSGTKVSLARSRRGGRIVIEYYSDEELARLYERLVGGTA